MSDIDAEHERHSKEQLDELIRTGATIRNSNPKILILDSEMAQIAYDYLDEYVHKYQPSDNVFYLVLDKNVGEPDASN